MSEFVINDQPISVEVEPKITSKGAITFVRNGRELGSIDAEFDLSSIQDDPELTYLAIRIIEGWRQRVHIAL